MKHLSTAIGTIALLWAGVALAGPIDTVIPTNPCPMPIGDLKLALVANEAGTDFGGMVCGSGGGCAETLIVCTNVGGTDDGPLDVGVELFQASGVEVTTLLVSGNGMKCGLAPGASVGFVTNGSMGSPYFGQTLAGGPLVPLGSLRIISSSPKYIACDVTLIDRTNVSAVGTTTGTKGVTVTRASKPQKGD